MFCSTSGIRKGSLGLFSVNQKRPSMADEQEVTLKTAAFDARFPNQNQTRNCWQHYIDFHRCQKIKGEDYEPCNYFKRVYGSMCPNAWVEKWDEQVEGSSFAGKI